MNTVWTAFTFYHGTAPQEKMLRVLRDINDSNVTRVRSAAPREVARAMWPDSVGWSKRTRKYGTNDPGALGGTMPMKAATVLWRLEDRGLAIRVGASYDAHANLWQITEHGRRVLDGHEQPRPPRSEG